MTTNSAVLEKEISSSKGLHIGLWVAQGLLAVAFGMAGWMKLTATLAQLRAMPWVNGAMGDYVRLIGAVELVAAIGLILPAATRILPELTTLAALGLTIVMALASLTHVVRGEFQALPITLVLGSVATLVAWGRARKAQIPARGNGTLGE
jgi:putative oxidoreductase